VFIFVGLAGLVGLDWPIFGLASVGELLGDGLVGFAVYVVLPLVGATWILSATWSELFPGR
jgi:hypothetical protein